MNIIFIACIVLAVAGIIWMVYDSSRNKGTKVKIEWNRLIDGRVVQIKPHRILWGRNKYNKTKQIEELHLPSVMRAPYPLEGVNPNEFELTDSGYPCVRLLQISEGQFIILIKETHAYKILETVDSNNVEILAEDKRASRTDIPREQFVAYTSEYLVDKDSQAWAALQIELNNQRMGAEKKGWEKWSPFIVPALALIISFMIIAVSINASKDIMADANGEIVESRNMFLDLVNTYAPGLQPSTSAPTDATAPPSAGGGE